MVYEIFRTDQQWYWEFGVMLLNSPRGSTLQRNAARVRFAVPYRHMHFMKSQRQTISTDHYYLSQLHEQSK